MIRVKQREGETAENFFRRFNQLVKNTGWINRVKAARYRTGKPNKNAVKKSAVHRLKVRQYVAYLEKVGKLEEYEARQSRKKRRR